MGAISETLFESELFGHRRGAFTDAKEDRAGRFEIASGGTLFLDEVGNLPLTLQAKLLAALENREVTRLGSNKPVPIDIRLISATNMPIHEMSAQKQFRQDLLYRINTIEIRLPALRERTSDIPLLADHFLAKFCKKYQIPLKRLGEPALRKLQAYRWPGNVRELQHTIERAVIMSDSAVLEPFDVLPALPEARTDGIVFENYNLEEAEKLILEIDGSKPDETLPTGLRSPILKLRYMPDEGYYSRIVRICEDRGWLLLADPIRTSHGQINLGALTKPAADADEIEVATHKHTSPGRIREASVEIQRSKDPEGVIERHLQEIAKGV